ncbi:MAG: radical SAM protein [Candidatus Omnitrophica bacterium]|nr:radical SAM protein [Candidatus Omnitrophota bacterium]
MKFFNSFPLVFWGYWTALRISSTVQKIFLGDRALVPLQCMIALTNQCNCHCSMCFFLPPTSKKEQLTAQEVSAVLAQLPRGSIVTLTGGEPTISPDFWPILENAVQRHMVQIFTNGTIWDERMIDRLIEAGSCVINFSLDAPCAEIHDALRGHGGAFQKVVRTIETIDHLRRIKHRVRPLIDVNMVLLPETVPYLSEMVDFCAQRNVNALSMSLDKRLITDMKDYCMDLDCLHRELINSIELAKKARLHLRLGNNFTIEDVMAYYSRSRVRLDSSPARDMSGFQCFAHWTKLVILSNGDVTQCNSLVGNIKKDKVMDIWNGIKMCEMRARVVKGKALTQDCFRCCSLSRSC